MIKEGVRKLIDGTDLTYEESQEIMKENISGKTTSAQIVAFLTALRMKGETVDEITAFTDVMKEYCHRIHPHANGRLVDTCRTGGDKIKTFNISTTAAFVVAGAGVAVAKHGNRSVTSKSGSADVLERLGLNLNMEPEAVEKSIEKLLNDFNDQFFNDIPLVSPLPLGPVSWNKFSHLSFLGFMGVVMVYETN